MEFFDNFNAVFHGVLRDVFRLYPFCFCLSLPLTFIFRWICWCSKCHKDDSEKEVLK